MEAMMKMKKRYNLKVPLTRDETLKAYEVQKIIDHVKPKPDDISLRWKLLSFFIAFLIVAGMIIFGGG
jgi:hypothetical protein